MLRIGARLVLVVLWVVSFFSSASIYVRKDCSQVMEVGMLRHAHGYGEQHVLV